MTTSRRAPRPSSIKVGGRGSCCAALIPAKLEQKTAVGQAACCSAAIIAVYRPWWHPSSFQGAKVGRPRKR